MKTLLTLTLGIVLGWSLTVGAEILSCNVYGQCAPVPVPGHWGPATQSQQEQLDWSLKNNLNNYLQQQPQRRPC